MATSEGATGSVSEDVCEAICYPSVVMVTKAEAVEAKLWRGAQPKLQRVPSPKSQPCGSPHRSARELRELDQQPH